MKKINLLLILTFACSLFASAQVARELPDGSFEQWKTGQTYGGEAYDELANPFWQTYNMLTSLPPDILSCPITIFKAEGRTGFAPKIASTNMTVNEQPAFLPGVVGAMTVNIDAQTASFGRPYTSRPISLRGYMKYTPVKGDSASIFVELYKNVDGYRIIIGKVEQIFKGNVNEWTKFELKLNYQSDKIPDAVSVLFVSSADYNFDNIFDSKGQAGSTLWVDDCKFVFPDTPDATFTAVSGSNTLEYAIIEGSTNVSAIGIESGSGVGDLIIPETVSHGGTTYTVTTIGTYAFEYCNGFTGSLTIPNSVTTIGDYAFTGCAGFSSIISEATTPPILGIDVFEYNELNENNILITVPCNNIDNYKGKVGWNYFLNYDDNRPYNFTVISDNIIRGQVQIISISDCEDEDYTVSFKAIPTKGFKFIRWNDGNAEIERTITLTEDTNLIASFEIAYTIEYDGNGGKGEMPPQVAAINRKTHLTANTFTRDGYTFSGWSNTAAGEVEYEDIAEVVDLADADEVATLYAIWKKGGDDPTSNELSTQAKFTIYPNPTSSILTIETTTEVKLYRIYSLQGILQGEFTSKGATTDIIVENLSAGVYILRAITTNGETINVRFVKN